EYYLWIDGVESLKSLNVDFITRVRFIWDLRYDITYLMTKANESYLTTKDELAIKINGPRDDDKEIKSMVMTQGSIGDKYSLIE
ncbi:19298_t:CDS:2, partial [Gigaspora margarita]